MVLPQTTRSVKAHAQSTKLTVICLRLVCSHVSKVVLFIPKVIKADTVLCLIDLDRHASVFSFKGPEKWDDRTFLHDLPITCVADHSGHARSTLGSPRWQRLSLPWQGSFTHWPVIHSLFYQLSINFIHCFSIFLWADAWINALHLIPWLVVESKQ